MSYFSAKGTLRGLDKMFETYPGGAGGQVSSSWPLLEGGAFLSNWEETN